MTESKTNPNPKATEPPKISPTATDIINSVEAKEAAKKAAAYKASPVKFSTMREVDIEEIWEDGQRDFAAWLEENTAMLGDALDITLVDAEKIGASDFTARYKSSGASVLIETQFNHTTHNNFGRILSHAASISAGVVVWIVTQAKDEHKNTVRWLNSGGRKADFYLIELRAYKVGDSAQAIKFEVVEKP